jgi:hypothetical protein
MTQFYTAHSSGPTCPTEVVPLDSSALSSKLRWRRRAWEAIGPDAELGDA